MIASDMAKQKENIIKDALDFHFGEKWDESEISNRCICNVDQFGNETYFIDDKPMLMFGRIYTDIKINAELHKPEFKCSQSFKVLYK